MAPISSHTNPNIATRASSRVPTRLSSVVIAISTSAITVNCTGVPSITSNCAMKGAAPVAIAASVTNRAQPYTQPAIHAQRFPNKRRAHG